MIPIKYQSPSEISAPLDIPLGANCLQRFFVCRSTLKAREIWRPLDKWYFFGINGDRRFPMADTLTVAHIRHDAERFAAWL
jgi:hypothetical protein